MYTLIRPAFGSVSSGERMCERGRRNRGTAHNAIGIQVTLEKANRMREREREREGGMRHKAIVQEWKTKIGIDTTP